MTDRESVERKQMEAPERIWLQDDGDWQLHDHGDEHVTRCQDKVNDNDTEYVRADLLAEAVGALHIIDALDPEEHINGCSSDALRGLVLRMGEAARAALATINGDKTNG